MIVSTEIRMHLVLLQQGYQIVLQLASVAMLACREDRVVTSHEEPCGVTPDRICQHGVDVT